MGYREYSEAKIKPTDNATGKEWEVTIIGPKSAADIVTVDGKEYLLSLNNRLYALEGLAASVDLWEGAQVYDNHLTNQEFEEKQGMRSPMREWLGAIVNPFWDAASKSLKGFFRVADEAAAAKFKNAFDLGILKTIGLSIDTKPIAVGEAIIQGIVMPLLNGFEEIFSLDVVGRPAAGGSFDRVIAAVTNNERKNTMDEEQVKQLIADAVSAAQAAIPATVKAAIAEALAEVEPGTQEGETTPAPELTPAIDPATQQAQAAALAATQEAQRARCELMLERKLGAAKLNGFEKSVREAFAGKIFVEGELDTMIKNLKEAQAAQDPTGRVSETGTTQVTRVMDEADKYGLELARLIMGNTDFNRLQGDNQDPMVQERLQEADFWKAWKKDGFSKLTGQSSRMSTLLEQWFGGNPLFDQRAMETASTSTLASVVKNTINIMVAADYSLAQRWYEAIVRIEEVDNIDDSTLVRVFGVNNLSVVPEGDAYTELALVDEEETASFVKNGNYVGITLEAMMRDKIGYVRTIPRRLSDAWYNTLSAMVAGVFTTNSATGPVLSDTGALFNATATSSAGGHANLLTTALGLSGYSAARTAMRKQTNQPLGAGRRTQLNPRYLLVPEDLETTALQIRNSEYTPGSANNDVNPFYNKFDVITVPDWTDANDWALVADPASAPAIFLIFPRGNRTPQLFTADSETAGAMFTNDVLRFKVRMFSYRFSSTYSVAPVADFRPLHKSNIA
jgi:hypothetical protein